MSLKSHFKFNKQERSGIFFLLLLIILLQAGYFIFGFFSSDDVKNDLVHDIEKQSQIDILKEAVLQKDSVKIYPFNPNFITDYKGYTLGMSPEEIDRLHKFRSRDEYVNSAEAFQKITLVSDSLLKSIEPYFKFPEWTKKNKQSRFNVKQKFVQKSSTAKNNFEIGDLNKASAEELMSIKGIGEKLSKRIIKFRDRLGGFLVAEQLYDVYYLEPEVAKRLMIKFKVFNKPSVIKININTSSAFEISSLVYINYALAKEIVSYRDLNGKFSSLNELTNIDDFPREKIDRIALYLTL